MRNTILAALVILTTALTIVFGADGEPAHTQVRGQFESYPLDRQSNDSYRIDADGTDDITAIDTETVTMFALTNSEKAGARQNVPVSLRFSDASQSATVYLVYWYKDSDATYVLKDMDSATIAATAAVDSSGYFMAKTRVFDGFGATHLQVMVSSVTSGTVTVRVGSY